MKRLFSSCFADRHGVFFALERRPGRRARTGVAQRPARIDVYERRTTDVPDVKTGAWTPRVVQTEDAKTAFVLGGYVGWQDTEKTEANVYRLDVSTSTFTKLVSEGTRRSARQLHAIAWARADSAGARSLRIAADGKTSEKGLFVLSLEPGREAWTRLDLPDAPPPRSSGSASRRPRGTSRAASATTATRTPT